MSMTGAWRIVEMDLWDAEAIDLLGPGYIQFGADRTGRFRFIAVEGWMDCHSGQCDGRPCVEFTWEGNDESDPVSGRGWAALEEDGSLRGHIYFHLGDDSGFRAVRAEDAPKSEAQSHPKGLRHLGRPACRRGLLGAAAVGWCGGLAHPRAVPAILPSLLVKGYERGFRPELPRSPGRR